MSETQNQICPACQTPNRESANYCLNCGSLLMQACPRCHNPLPETPSYCDHCGLRLVDPAGYNWWQAADSRAARSAAPSNEKPATALKPPQPAPAPSAPASTITPPPSQPATPVAKPAIDSQLQQYIPKELLTKLDAVRTHGEMVGERRVVTMLFCDVIGSTAAAELMDPEEWSEIINGAFEHMIRPVYTYEGTVARLMGDGILAFFGAPIAHEDDPQRAVLAGLDIVAGIKVYHQQVKQRYDLEFDVRVGINTGMVVVGAVGSDLRMEYTALGDAINLAARMEETALPGSVQISHDTYKLVKTQFEFEELGGIEVKGKAEPVLAYRALGRKAIGTRNRGIEGLHAEMVGREAELLTLRNVVTDLKQGVGRIVGVLGEAGLGKSRLVHETYQIFKELSGSESDWYETTSLSYETNQAYGLFQRLIRRMAGIAHNDPPAAIRAKLAALVESLGEEAQSNGKQLIEALFGLGSENGGQPLQGEAFKSELLEVMRGWWRVRFADRPSVLVFEDMHWSDSASVELLQQLLPLIGAIPLVLVCVLRTERQVPAWQIKTTADEEFRHRYTEVNLRPLSESESNELVNRLLAIAELPDSLRLSILERSGGNPFFIEEVVRTLIDSGVVVSEMRNVNGKELRYWRAVSEGADFDIPDNLQSLLAARVDRLEEDTRGTLQIASVIGRTFHHRVLQSVDEASQELDKHLGTLLKLDMIREAARLPELEYAFRNPMTQEAVYNTILLKRRRDFHRRVGEAMEAIYAERLEGLYGLLAHHFALSSQRDKAVAYYRQAAQQAVALYAYEDAIRNLRLAYEIIASQEKSETHLILLEALGDVYRLLRDGGRAIDQYQQALELWSGLADGDRLIAIRLHCKIVEVVTELKWSVGLDYLQQVHQSRLASRAFLEESLEFLDSRPPQLVTVQVLIALSMDAWRIQEPPDWETAQRFAQSAVDMAKQLDDPVVLSQALGALATVLDGRSLLREHLQVTQQRLEICRRPQFDNAAESVEALRSTGAAWMYVGEYRQAMPFLQEAESLAVQIKLVEQQANALGLQAQCWFRLDQWDEVISLESKWRDLERRYSRERVGET
ncbi:MAG TPA: adenylate/guanylate cyclase domain-containing protein [Anaerolineales bacterium]|nr:adenylate/guanylate cyclase domain-containing protein [Anaerolineales bacterium]